MHMFYTHMIAVALFPLLALLPQTPPNFSGIWEVIDISPPPASGGASLPPSDLTIRHTAESVSLSRTAFGQVTTTVYSLDGREDKNLSGAVTRLTRSKWVGATLVTEGRMSQVTSAGYEAWTLKYSIRLDARGQLILERETLSDTGDTFRSTITHRKKAVR